MNKCKLAQELLEKTVNELNPDIVMITEQNRNKNNWFNDTKGDSAIWVTNHGIQKGYSINLIKQGTGMVAISYNEFIIISSYISPNISSEIVNDRLDEISIVLKHKNGVVLSWLEILTVNHPYGEAAPGTLEEKYY